MSKKDKKSDNSQESKRIQAGRDYFERVEGDIYIGASPSGDPTALRDAYLKWLFKKVTDVPLADIDPQMAAMATDDPESRLRLDAIYTALLTISSEQRVRTDKTAPMIREDSHPLPALAQLDQHQYLVLLGDPGSGKSTFVNFVTMCLAGALLDHPTINLDFLRMPFPESDNDDKQKPQPWQHGALLPVRIILQDFAAEGFPADGQPVTGNHLWQFIARELQQEGFEEFIPHLKHHLWTHGGLILLDGLDEVPSPEMLRPQIQRSVEGCLKLFPLCRILVTSRTYAYQTREWKLTGFAETTLARFTASQIRYFVRHWYLYIAALRGMSEQEVLDQADDLNEKILENTRLQELAERPLLLTLMTILHSSRGTLPEKRVELYEETVKLLLHRWEWKKIKRRNAQGTMTTEYSSLFKLLDVDREKILTLLGDLAYHAHKAQPVGQEKPAHIQAGDLLTKLLKLSKDRRITIEQIEEHLRNRAGVLIAPAEGIYTFPHRSFQEYLAAYYFTRQVEYPDNIAEAARNDPNRWREIVLLAAGVAALPRMTWDLVEALCYKNLDEADVMPEDAWGALLAGQALIETTSLEDMSRRHRAKAERVRKWLMTILTEQQPKDAPFPAVERALAGNILAQIGDPRPGVGLREDGLPDIEWCEIPEGIFLMGSKPEKDRPAEDTSTEATGESVEVLLERYYQSQSEEEQADLAQVIIAKWIRSEQPQHEVFLSAYFISRYPVTNKQYQVFVENGGYTDKWRHCWSEEGWKWKEEQAKDSPAKVGGDFDLPNHPVVAISWYEASAFCSWLTFRLRDLGELSNDDVVRLPTEAEWEKAARGNDGRIYPWGDEITPELANYADTGLGVTSTVGCFPRGNSPYGCEDMAGNVWDWCLDWYGENYYSESPEKDPPGPVVGSYRVDRGGSWIRDARYVRSAYRGRDDPGTRDRDVGFRLLRTPS